MASFKIILVVALLLLSGDFVATFLYHVPEHIFGRYHHLVHHSSNRSFIRYAFLTKNPLVLISGFLAAFPYLVFVPGLWTISPLGTIVGLLIAECHVQWRHSSLSHHKTPLLIQKICQLLWITTPERHEEHHRNSRVAYGDIFTFYDQPAQFWYRFLLKIKKKKRTKKTAFFSS